MAHSQSVQTQLQRAISTHNLILELHPQGKCRATVQNRLFDALCDLTIEHLGAIILLAKTEQHYGSAFALLRPLIESVLRAFWILHSASDEMAIRIAKREVDFPTFKSIQSALKKHYEKAGFQRLFAISPKFITTLHGLTHSGVEQLVNRLGSKPDYSDKDIVTVLDQASRFTVMVSMERIQLMEGSEHILSPKTDALLVRFQQIVGEDRAP